MIPLTETSGTSKGTERESSLGVLRVWAGGERGRVGPWFGVSFGEGMFCRRVLCHGGAASGMHSMLMTCSTENK